MVKATEQVFPGQSDGKSHELSRNAMTGKGMQTTVDSKATSDPYYNSSSSASNVQGNSPTNSGGNAGIAGTTYANIASKMKSRSMLVPAGAGIAGFAGGHMLLRSLPPTYLT